MDGEVAIGHIFIKMNFTVIIDGTLPLAVTCNFDPKEKNSFVY
jgi:hypothetical protein